MKKRTELESLLSEVLAEEEPTLGRAKLLSQTLQQARGKRQRRVLFRGSALSAALLVILGVWLWPTAPHPRKEIGLREVRLVITQPLPRSETIESQWGLTPIFRSSASELLVVETQSPTQNWQALDDQQLLNLLDRPVVLVRADPGHTELIFCNSTDRNPLLNQ